MKSSGNILQLGLDVHKESIAVAIACGSTTGLAALATWEFLRKPRSAFLCWLNSSGLKTVPAKTPEKQGFPLILVSYEAASLSVEE
jgi:hypothetical protein